MRRRWVRPLASLAAIRGLTLSTVALASFSGTNASPPAMTISSATLGVPTGVSAVRDQCTVVTGPWKVKVTWTAVSAPATGYEILRSTTSGSGYGSVGTVSGVSTTTFIDSSPAASTRYYYVVRSTRNSWTGANSAQDPVTTDNAACIGGSDT